MNSLFGRPARMWFSAIAVASAMFATNVHAQAETTRIGVVNVDRILTDAAPAKAASAKIEAEFAKRDKDLQDMGTRLKTLSEKLDRDNAVLSDTDRGRRQREVADLDRDLQRRQREMREDLNQRRNEELAQIFDKVQRVIKQIAEQEKLDLVIREAVFVNPRIDITDKVIRALGNGASTGAAAPATGK